jgi:hypothetical protein
MITRPSQYLKREEMLALFCSLIVTSLLAVLLQQLKSNDDEMGRPSTLTEYEEFPFPPIRQKSLPGTIQMRSGKKPRGRTEYSVAPASSDSTVTAQTREAVLPDELPAGRGLPWDSVVTPQSFVFRDHKSDAVLDSIFRTDSTARQALLRQHLWFSSSVYDTASILPLVRLSSVMQQFDDKPVTLQESMQRNMRRYGHPYDPTRPQPLSPQIPLGGVISRLFGIIF